MNGTGYPAPGFGQDVRAVLRTYGPLIPRQVREVIADAADHIEALERRVARLEQQLAALGESKT